MQEEQEALWNTASSVPVFQAATHQEMSLPREENLVLCPGRASMACGWVTGSCAGPMPVRMSPPFESLGTEACFFKRKINPMGLGTQVWNNILRCISKPAFLQCFSQGQFFQQGQWGPVSAELSEGHLGDLGKALLIHFLFMLCLNLKGAHSSTKPSTTAEEEELHATCLLRYPQAPKVLYHHFQLSYVNNY